MNEWEIAAAVLGAALVPCLAVCVLGRAADALVSVAVASTLLVCILMALAEGFNRQPFIDLALTLALVSVVGVLVFARLLEEDL